MELNYKVQNYEWGKRGSKSKVATLLANVDKSFKIDEEKPYAELWIGTHVNAPSVIKATGEPLSDIITKHPDFLGSPVRGRFGDQLPFLFKVLSVNQALSIQAHPNKKHAEELHSKSPDIYKDPNHKPELAIALTPFEALCGFRPLNEVYSFFKSVPELAKVIGSNILDKYNKGNTDDINLLKDALRAVLTAPKNTIATELENLIKRLKSLDHSQRGVNLADLVERLHSFYPGDVGCFVVYFLNYLELKPFEAIYLGANEPHAYISGDCIECMACSDNVVRAGLTPKFIDVDTLCSMLIYKGEKPEDKIFKAHVEDKYRKIFKPPVPDFAVTQIQVPKSDVKYELPSRQSASTLLVISGKARSGSSLVIPGAAFFLPSGETFKITDIAEDLLIYQGLANV